MSISQKGIDLIKEFEGLRLVAYQDSVGIWTIGYGCTTDVAPGMKITQAQAEERLKRDLRDAEKAVNEAVTVQLTPGEFDALVSIVFNVGAGRKASGNDKGRDGIITLKNGEPSTLLRLVNEGDFEAAAREFRRWDKAGGVPLDGLRRRRYAESKLFEDNLA